MSVFHNRQQRFDGRGLICRSFFNDLRFLVKFRELGKGFYVRAYLACSCEQWAHLAGRREESLSRLFT